MGAGNWYPSVNRGERHNYELLYIDADAIYGTAEEDLEDDDRWINYATFQDDVLSCLPKSFAEVNIHRHHDQFILAENRMFECIIHDNQWSIAIALIVKESAPMFAENKLSELGKLVFDRMHDIYGDYTRVRSGPWMSGPYKSKAIVNATAS